MHAHIPEALILHWNKQHSQIAHTKAIRISLRSTADSRSFFCNLLIVISSSASEITFFYISLERKMGIELWAALFVSFKMHKFDSIDVNEPPAPAFFDWRKEFSRNQMIRQQLIPPQAAHTGVPDKLFSFWKYSIEEFRKSKFEIQSSYSLRLMAKDRPGEVVQALPNEKTERLMDRRMRIAN